jgi:hypothetical protein
MPNTLGITEAMCSEGANIVRTDWVLGLTGLALAVGVIGGFVAGKSTESAGTVAAASLGTSIQEIYEGPDDVTKIDRLTALYADDAVIDDLANGDHFEGEFEREWANKVFLESPGLDMVIEELIVGDGVLAMRWTATGTDGNGDEFELPGVTTYELDGDLILHERYYYNERQAPTF